MGECCFGCCTAQHCGGFDIKVHTKRLLTVAIAFHLFSLSTYFWVSQHTHINKHIHSLLTCTKSRMFVSLLTEKYFPNYSSFCASTIKRWNERWEREPTPGWIYRFPSEFIQFNCFQDKAKWLNVYTVKENQPKNRRKITERVGAKGEKNYVPKHKGRRPLKHNNLKKFILSCMCICKRALDLVSWKW